MSKAVLISIQPKWCELILRGKKTIEVRKTKPKLDVPFKCYIYQSKGRDRLIEIMKDGDENYGEIYHGKPVFIKTMGYRSGYKGLFGREQKIVGEFLCDKITRYPYNSDGYGIKDEKELCAASGLKPNELYHYLQGHKPYAWHISDLVIYPQPKELSEFYKPCIYAKEGECAGGRCAKALFTRSGLFDDCGNTITSPPQSWCYVEQEV